MFPTAPQVVNPESIEYYRAALKFLSSLGDYSQGAKIKAREFASVFWFLVPDY